MTAREIIAKVKDLPVVSETSRKLTALLNNPHLHSEDLVATLRCDAVLTAKLLRTCNSARLGLREPVSSVDQAVMLLGHNTIFRMVCALGYASVLGAPMPGYAVEAKGLWSHSLATAYLSESLAANEFDGQFEPAMAFTAGLLHDIGKLVLTQTLTPEVQTVIRAQIAGGASRPEAEKAVLGADHSEVGACLLQNWRLPARIIEAVANHHNPVTTPQLQLSGLVYLSNNVVHLLGSAPGWDGFAVRVDQQARLFDLAEHQLERIMLRAHESIRQVDQLMETL